VLEKQKASVLAENGVEPTVTIHSPDKTHWESEIANKRKKQKKFYFNPLKTKLV
jgi:hypothetical protein